MVLVQDVQVQEGNGPKAARDSRTARGASWIASRCLRAVPFRSAVFDAALLGQQNHFVESAG
jgi:hypothetical protein